jgi:hypothetical protein
MCTVLLPPSGNTIAVNKYIISYYINPEFLGSLFPEGDLTLNGTISTAVLCYFLKETRQKNKTVPCTRGSQNIRFRSFYYEYKHMIVRNTRVIYSSTISLFFGVVTTSVTAVIALLVPRVNDASCRL